MTEHNIWQEYSTEVLAWQLGQPLAYALHFGYDAIAATGSRSGSDLESPLADASTAAQRLLRMSTLSQRPLLTLMGIGDGTLAAHLLSTLPHTVNLRILEPSPHRARAVLTHFPQLQACLLVDTSPWALLLLALHAGLTPDNCTLGRAHDQTYSREDARTLAQWRKLFFGTTPETLLALNPCTDEKPRISPKPAAPSAMAPRISVGAILHPSEPQLYDFFAHIPAWVHEVCVVWDGHMPANTPLPCAAPLHQRVRPLGNDFSQQRNAMLDMCSGDWCLYLDADERLTPETWQTLPMLAALPGVDNVLFPRLTFEGSEEKIRMGYGLWPDVQCRFFARNAAVHFQGAIHEHVHGLAGQSLLTPGMPLYHYSHVQKNHAQVEEKLGVFNKAAAGSTAKGATDTKPLHVSSAAYPSLPRAHLEHLGHAFGAHTVLRLPLQA